MSKAGSKIIKGLKEARAVAKGKKRPARATVVKQIASEKDVMGMFFWLNDLAATELRLGRPVTLRVQFEFPGMKPKRKRRTA